MKTTKKVAYEWEHGKVSASWDSSQKDALVYLTHKPNGVRQNDQDMAMSPETVRDLKELLSVVLGAVESDRNPTEAARPAELPGPGQVKP